MERRAHRCASHHQPGGADWILKTGRNDFSRHILIARVLIKRSVSFHALFPRVKFSNESLITSEILSFLPPVFLLVTFTPMNILSLALAFRTFSLFFLRSTTRRRFNSSSTLCLEIPSLVRSVTPSLSKLLSIVLKKTRNGQEWLVATP